MIARGFDGTRLHVTEMGEGPTLLLLHGLFSSAETNWIRYGTARRLVEAGYRLVMPDFRGHGQSDVPTAPEAWPADVLAMDIEALVDQLGLGHDYVLGGYSLGARTVVRLLARGARPRGAILAGMGLKGIVGGADRGQWFIRMIEGRGSWPRGTGEFVAESFMKQSVKDPQAIIHLLRGQQSTPPDVLAGLDLPALVVCGADDQDNGSAPELAAALSDATYAEIPGNHMGSVTRPELATAMILWLERQS
jgi:pimeloyl-ACP methyl ester carboxylesterase